MAGDYNIYNLLAAYSLLKELGLTEEEIQQGLSSYTSVSYTHLDVYKRQELVCSNSLRANNITNAVGLLKEEMRMLDSLIMKCADATQVPAGGALAVDRDKF